MEIIYSSLRIGKYGKKFYLYKFRTLKEGFSEVFVNDEGYTKWGKWLRRTKLDELPQLWNVLKGEMRLVGIRPEEERTINLIPEDLRKILLSIKPGMTSLSSLHFYDEEEVLRQGQDVFKDFWTRIKPAKIMLDIFYIQNRSFLFDCAILWATFKKVIKSLWNG